MAKITLNNISTLENNTSLTKINENFQTIVDEFDNVLSLDGTSPSTMLSDLDMNSNQILNLPDATTDQEPLTYGQFNTYYADILTKAAQVTSDKDAVAALYDSFDDRYLGAKSSAPANDNDGNPLLTGALYFNTTSNTMWVYNGSSWVEIVGAVGNGDMLKSVYDTDDNGIVDAAESVPWSGVTSTPTTFSGYGVTDGILDSLQFTGGTGNQGTVSWNTDEETLDLIQNGAILQLGQEEQIHCRNNSGSTIANGTPVMATGTLGASGRITISPMVGSTASNFKYLLGITTEEIANDTDGKVTSFGKVRSVDTTNTSIFTGTIADGDVLWIDPVNTGKLTNTEPTGSSLNMPVAFVIHAASNGTIFVRVTPINENAFATYAQGALADSSVQPGDNVSDLVNDAGYLTSETYTGTVTSVGLSAPTGLTVSGSPVTSSGTLALTYTTGYSIPTDANQSNWTTAYGWGDHSTAGYLTSYTETDPIYTASSWYTTTNNSTNWDTAYGWGDHSTAGYLTSFTETDPVVGAVSGIVKADGAGNISAAIAGTDYLASETYTGTVTSVAMTVPTGLAVTGSPITSSGTLALAMDTGYAIPTTASQTNWNTAYGWGDHSTQGYLTTVTASDVDSGVAADGYVLTSDGAGNAAWEAVAGSGTVTSVAMTVPTGLTVTGSPITGAGTLAVAFDTGYSIPTTANQTNWTTAYNWGDHSTAGYLTTETYTGTVTSVNLTAGTGVSVSGGPITSSGSITVTNTAPDQTVTLTEGSNVTITGTYPNFTIASTDTNTTYTAGSGLTLTGTTFSANIGTDIQAYDADTMKTDVAQTMTAQLTVKETAETNYNLTGSDVDPVNGTIQYKTTTGSETITGNNFANGQSVTLRLTAATAVTFTGFNWVTSDGNAPTIGSNNDVFVLWMDNSVKFVAYVGHD